MDKKQAWERLQNEAPAASELLTLLTATFGKPQAVGIQINGATILNTGGWCQPKELAVQLSYQRRFR